MKLDVNFEKSVLETYRNLEGYPQRQFLDLSNSILRSEIDLVVEKLFRFIVKIGPNTSRSEPRKKVKKSLWEIFLYLPFDTTRKKYENWSCKNIEFPY